jgi:hypothetical protein
MIAKRDNGGRIVSKVVPAAVLKSGTIPKINRPGKIVSAPDCPNAPPKTPENVPKRIVDIELPSIL